MAKTKSKNKFKLQNHSLIPKHALLKEKEKKELFEKYNISERELPKIAREDAGIKHLDGKEGDVVRIIRKSATAGEIVYYRVVTNE